MLFLFSTTLGFASQPATEDCSVLQDTCDGCTETGPGDSFISFLNLDQFHSKYIQGDSRCSRPTWQSAVDPTIRAQPTIYSPAYS